MDSEISPTRLASGGDEDGDGREQQRESLRKLLYEQQVLSPIQSMYRCVKIIWLDQAVILRPLCHLEFYIFPDLIGSQKIMAIVPQNFMAVYTWQDVISKSFRSSQNFLQTRQHFPWNRMLGISKVLTHICQCSKAVANVQKVTFELRHSMVFHHSIRHAI